VRPIDCYGHRSRMAEPCSIRPIDTARALRNVGPHATTSSRVRAFSANCCASEGFLVKGLSRKSCRRIGLIMTRLLLVRVLVWVFIASPVPAGGRAQTHSGFPVDIVAGPPPQPLASEGRTWLVYELHLTNYAPLPIELTEVEVFGDGGTTLASYRGQELAKAVVAVEQLSSADSPAGFAGTRTLGEGHAAMMFINFALEPGVRQPNELHHRLSFAVTRKNGETIQRAVDGAEVPVVQEPVPVVAAPLRGSLWIAFNALSSADHRRSLNAMDGRERIPQRFAID